MSLRGELILELQVVLYNAIVDDSYLVLAIGVGMSVLYGGFPMGSPPRVTPTPFGLGARHWTEPRRGHEPCRQTCELLAGLMD